MRDEEREDHPSYGRIMVSRSQGGPGVLSGPARVESDEQN
jgi:hypothetical protein